MSLKHTKLICKYSDPFWCVFIPPLHAYALSDLLLVPGLGGYNITLVTAPSKGPFRFHTLVTLSCQLNPQPPGRVTYSWKSSDPNSGLPSGNRTSPTVTVRINYEHLCFGWYFCYVYSDGTLVGVGRTLVETAEGQSHARNCFYVEISAVCIMISLCCRIHSYQLATYTVLYTW